MAEYRFVFTENSSGEVASGLPMQTVSNGLPQQESGEVNSVVQSFGNSVIQKAENAVLSPLNQIMGGLATPVYTLAKALEQHSDIVAEVGGLAFAGVKLTVKLILNEYSKTDARVAQANERDNMLLRAGAVSHATFYERDGISGIRKKSR